MSKNKNVPITLAVDNWKVIMELIKSSCQHRGGEWVKWGEEIYQLIESSISEGRDESKIRKYDVSSSPDLISIQYDENSKILEIQYSNGSICQFYEVPKEIFSSLVKSDSNRNKDYFVNRLRHLYNAYQAKMIQRESFHGFSSPADNMTSLKNTLGMDHISNDEFETWLEDEADD